MLLGRKYSQKGWWGYGGCGRSEVWPLKVLEEKLPGPNGGVALSQDTASSGLLAKLTPAGPGQGQNCQPMDAMHIGENFTLPIYEYVSLSIKSIFET